MSWPPDFDRLGRETPFSADQWRAAVDAGATPLIWPLVLLLVEQRFTTPRGATAMIKATMALTPNHREEG